MSPLGRAKGEARTAQPKGTAVGDATWRPERRWRTWAATPLGPPDPYLVWAQLTGWAHFGMGLDQQAPGDVVHRVPLLVQLRPRKTVAELRAVLKRRGLRKFDVYVPAIYADDGPSPAQGWVVTMWVPRELLEKPDQLEPLRSLVARIEMAAPMKSRTAGLSGLDEASTDEPPPPERPPVLRGQVLLGVIDTLCPFMHGRMQTGLGTRIASVWSVGHRAWLRGAEGYGAQPTGFDHGHAVSRRMNPDGKDLDHWLARQPTWPGGLRDELDLALQAMQAKAGAGRRTGEHGRLASRVSHGAAVLDVLCGPVRPRDRLAASDDGLGLDPDGLPSWTGATDVAADPERSDVVFVDLPAAQIHDSTGGWLGPHVLDGLRYIVACAGKRTKHIIANISYGGTTGPHDGSSILDQAMVDLCDREPRLHVVLAAGNSFDKRLHALLRPATGAPAALTWFVPPGNEKPAFMELWLDGPKQAQVTTFTLTSPTGAQATLRAGEVQQLVVNGQAVATAIYLTECSRGRGALLLLAIAPTDASRTRRDTEAPHGQWQVQASCTGPAGDVHAWIARNDRDRGSLLRGRRSMIVDPLDDPSRFLRGNRDDPGKRTDDPDGAGERQGSVIRRRGSLSGIAGARHDRIHVISGYVLQSGDHAPYASAGDRSASRGVGPTAAAASDQSRVLPGQRVAGAHGAVTTRLVGTSVAAPMFARRLAEQLDRPSSGPHRPPPPAPVPPSIQDPVDLYGPVGRTPLAQLPPA